MDTRKESDKKGRGRANLESTHKAALRDHPVADPKSLSAHEVGQHDICKEPVSDNGNFRRGLDVYTRGGFEVLDELCMASWFL